METEKTIRILLVDAWHDGSGWTWNNWHTVGSCPLSWCDYSPRKLLRTMRAEGYLSADSAGKCAVEDDQYNIVVTDRHNGMPLFALEYGPAIY